MNKERIKEIIYERMTGRRIILFGAGEVAQEFYHDLKDHLSISHCVSNYYREWKEKGFLGELDIRQYNRQNIEKTDYMIICGYFSFNYLERQLVEDGFKPYEDFVTSGIASAVFFKQKIALFYGSCILRDVFQNINMLPEFKREYSPVFIQASKDPQVVLLSRELAYAKQLADICIYMPRVMEKESSFNIHPDMLPRDCKMISVSNLVVPLYWPNVKSRLYAHNPDYIFSYVSKRDMNFWHTLYRKEDVNINRMVSKGMKTEEIIRELSSDDFYTKQQIDRKLKTIFSIAEMGEEGMDVRITDYIKANYKKTMLYQNYVHPNRSIIWRIVERLAIKMGLSTESLEETEKSAPYHPHQSGDVPIYPSVAKHMELEFVTPQTQYEIMTEEGIRLMDFKGYVEHYVRYTELSRQIRGMW